MSSPRRHFVIQTILLVVWIMFMVSVHTTYVEARYNCPNYKYLRPFNVHPGWSWRPNRTIIVSIDDGWTEPDRNVLQMETKSGTRGMEVIAREWSSPDSSKRPTLDQNTLQTLQTIIYTGNE